LVRKSLIVILCMLSSAAFAQEGSRRGLFLRPDTTFAVRHPYRFTIRPHVGSTFGMFSSQWTTEEGPHDYSLMSSPVIKAGCSVSYLHCLSLYHYGEIAFTEGTVPLGHRVNHGGSVKRPLSAKKVALCMNRLGFEQRRTHAARGWNVIILTGNDIKETQRLNAHRSVEE
jgi:hypothetical protein